MQIGSSARFVVFTQELSARQLFANNSDANVSALCRELTKEAANG